jgi:hypothetical protein
MGDVEPINGRRRPFDTPLEQVELDIAEGFVAYLEEVREGLWADAHPPGGISFAEYRRDYWREEWGALATGTY